MKRWICLLLSLLLVLSVCAFGAAAAEVHTVSVRVLGEGAAIPGGTVPVVDGGSLTLSFLPEDGWRLAAVYVDGFAASHALPLYLHCQDCDGCEQCSWIDWSMAYTGMGDDNWDDWKNAVTLHNVGQDHLVYVHFVEQEEPVQEEDVVIQKPVFSDLDANAWYAEAVSFALEQKLMDGMGGGRFDPDGTVTRAQLVTMLWRLENKPNIGMVRDSFVDVEKDQWYTLAVEWAADLQLVNGHNGLFRPNDPITREQLAAILWRFSNMMGLDVSVGEDTNILSYNDAFDVSDYAFAPLQWACGAGVMNGAGGNLMPQGQATRAQAAAMLYRMHQLFVQAVNP